MSRQASFFRKRIAVPQEHGSWMFLFLPLLTGLVASRGWRIESAYLVVTALAVFFMRQPMIAMSKVRGGRRPPSDLPAAWGWLGIYGSIALLHVIGLVLRGHAGVLLLGLPAAVVALWHAWLVMHRAERRQELMEILAAGALALSAPAAQIVMGSEPPLYALAGLWIAPWLAAAAMITCTYLCLDQRTWHETGGLDHRVRSGVAALSVPIGGIALVAVASVDPLGTGMRPSPWWYLPFAIQLGEAIRCTLRPGLGKRPRQIGIEQLLVNTVVLIAFLWSASR